MKPIGKPRTLTHTGTYPKDTRRLAFEIEPGDVGVHDHYICRYAKGTIHPAQVGDQILVFTFPDGRTCWQFDPH